ncbi:MAG: hypothetical protein JNL32_13275, partial [Candidatus Kapabacteria bacterium]|nr:hypothetical protein [Candidatus Kapabacteria bacterium]
MKELLRLKSYFLRYKHLFGMGLLFITCSNICSAIYPRLVGKTVDAIAQGGFTPNALYISIAYILL